jgi:glycosyltransferase involved in cell wall biosynthesis
LKILFDHPSPFFLTHGGFQTQIQETKRALESTGLEIEWVRWWDANQTGDIIHFFGAAPVDYIEQAREKSLKVVQTMLFTATCNRNDLRLKLQGAIIRALLAAPIGRGIKRQLNWRSFLLCDMNVVGLEAERQVLEWVYRVPPARISVVPLGVSQEFLTAGAAPSRGDFLICVGTITERKNTVALARMAYEAKVPILFVGKPYGLSGPYWEKFAALIDNRWVRYHPHVENSIELIKLYHGARGSVVMSRYENWCLAAHEATACGLPLLLAPLKWARERFGTEAHYFSGHAKEDIRILRQFYEQARTLPAPNVKLPSWHDVGTRLNQIYADVVASSR